MADRWELDLNSRKRFTQSKSVGSYSQSQFTNQSLSSFSLSSTADHKISVNSNKIKQINNPHQNQDPHLTHSHSKNHQEQVNGSYGNAPRMMKSKSGSWQLDEADIQRRKRVASYKSYAMEDRFKSSFRKSFRWLKDKYSNIRHGLW